MAVFSQFNERLPDPMFDVNNAGAQVTLGSGLKGPGFASVKVVSRKDTQISRTRSGRVVGRDGGSHIWEIDITYNPMTRSEFDIVQSFLDSRNSRLYPFYVVLPQHSKPKNATFANTILTNTVRANESALAGASYMFMDMGNPLVSFTTFGTPLPGDYFNVDDLTDLNHKKTYKVTRVETIADYNSLIPGGTPTNHRVRVHFTPPLVRDVPADAIIRFTEPSFRMIMRSDIIEYDLNTDNLYQFGLQLEEALP